MQIITRCVQIGTVAMLFFLCGLAMAQLTETFTASTPYTDLANYGSAASGPELEFLAFPLFNSSLGTLTGISLTVTGGTGTNNDVYPNTDIKRRSIAVLNQQHRTAYGGFHTTVFDAGLYQRSDDRRRTGVRKRT